MSETSLTALIQGGLRYVNGLESNKGGVHIDQSNLLTLEQSGGRLCI